MFTDEREKGVAGLELSGLIVGWSCYAPGGSLRRRNTTLENTEDCLNLEPEKTTSRLVINLTLESMVRHSLVLLVIIQDVSDERRRE